MSQYDVVLQQMSLLAGEPQFLPWLADDATTTDPCRERNVWCMLVDGTVSICSSSDFGQIALLNESQPSAELPGNICGGLRRIALSLTSSSKIVVAQLREKNGLSWAADENVGAASITATRDDQRGYVQKVRGELELAMRAHRKTALAAPTVRPVVQSESAARSALLVEELKTREQICSLEMQRCQRIQFDNLQELRRETTLVPWCTMSCKYCCMTKLEWQRAVRRHYSTLLHAFLQMRETLRAEVMEDESSAFRALSMQHLACIGMLKRHAQEFKSITADESADRCVVLAAVLEDVSLLHTRYHELRGLHSSYIAAKKFREEHVAVMRLQENLVLREHRLMCNWQHQVFEEERFRRANIVALDGLHRKERQMTFEMQREEIAVSAWRSGMVRAKEERDELKQREEEKQRAEEAQRVAAAKAVQNDLEEEFKEIKRLKKQGPPKNLPLPQCPRCHEIPKDLFSHRITECTERPVQCARCERVMKASQAEEHKNVCPSRPLPCPTCGQNYKAEYLENVHSTKCRELQVARRTYAALRPTLPFELVLPDASTAGFAADFTAAPALALQYAPRCTILEWNGRKMTAAPSSLRIGESNSLLLRMPDGSTNVFPFDIGTNIPMSEFLELQEVVQSDDAQISPVATQRPTSKAQHRK